ncbi:MAG: ribonuclease HII [Flavobacteriales bacterium]
MLKSRFSKELTEAGCDEAGRGCLAGPVVAAAVILPEGYKHRFLNDSKKLTEKVRLELRWEIMETAVAWAIGSCSPKEIDEINILKASFEAMHRAITQLKLKPQLLLIDGNRFTPYAGIDHQCIIGGDAKYLSIAAASILAKTERDMIMEKLHEEHPLYHWNQNKGYPTTQHRKAIEQFGSTIHHRKSFTLLPPQMKLEF